ncbi:SMP-30/gluconolactonase/LRE family protein [Pseudooceanicola sediminis]|uniref:SMP-30/gluconolactonase/LRE family protein n=1 Tax=Pseudooceanicola sediminis TaxID=2211117 RepID=A0A399J0L8_9RHOB|nr:SMP-30/gluconolactonase/LRE family protein [Pseudooceanicola sediminis]KAA2315100.1 SMP-30/gluconolactonase/LRE family protein [Puniceibacterium sp. HSS470]RII38915.1 SMP-30/gluconolactonase/LRE family protein [Pseudooceanicola sediminis]|tara:strand:+ start:48695 stop:49600 length:906 start_codon:yes stop_codon:yes gene_type:complete
MPEARSDLSVDGLTVHRISTAPADLGESPLWMDDTLWWIDGVAGRIHCLDGRAFDLGGHIGGIAPASGGGLILSRDHEVLRFDPATAETTSLLTLAGADPLMRLNDVKLDRQGRFLCAGMGRDGTGRGALHQLDGVGRHRVLHRGIRIGNGLCLSPDGTTLYLADTPERSILACDYTPETGKTGPFRLHVDTGQHGSGVDGATVDAAGNLWAAMIHSAQIACFAPDGRLIRQVPAPTDLPSSLAFGGPARDRLFVTSIRDSGTGRAVSSHPDGGHVFALDGLGAAGLPEAVFTPHSEGTVP